jgi:hypothetical protein
MSERIPAQVISNAQGLLELEMMRPLGDLLVTQTADDGSDPISIAIPLWKLAPIVRELVKLCPEWAGENWHGDDLTPEGTP